MEKVGVIILGVGLWLLIYEINLDLYVLRLIGNFVFGFGIGVLIHRTKKEK